MLRIALQPNRPLGRRLTPDLYTLKKIQIMVVI
jgi:hypothetical protein